MKAIILALMMGLTSLSLSAGDKEFDCLVRNVYYESKSEPRNGKLAVALVTLNRVDDPRYPDTICDVVYQKNQFSWTKNKKLLSYKINHKQWQEAKAAAIEAYMNRGVLGQFMATHFHNDTVKPKWRLIKVARIGNHTFYKS
jgi:spore germination cell wall hydrolase CwlJ-like protein